MAWIRIVALRPLAPGGGKAGQAQEQERERRGLGQQQQSLRRSVPERLPWQPEFWVHLWAQRKIF